MGLSWAPKSELRDIRMWYWGDQQLVTTTTTTGWTDGSSELRAGLGFSAGEGFEALTCGNLALRFSHPKREAFGPDPETLNPKIAEGL